MNDPSTPPPPPGDSYGQPPAAPPPGGPPAGGPPAGHRPGLAWEQSKDANSLLTTVKRLITSPGAAFDDVKEKGDYASPLLFAIILILLGAMFAAFWQLLFGPPDLSQLEELGPEFAELAGAFSGSAGAGGVISTLIFTVLFSAVWLFIWSGIVHLMLNLLGGLRDSTAGFEGTFRGVSYSYVAHLAQLVPLVGGLIAFVWLVALQMIGLSSIHRTSQGKAIAAVLIPFFICCCIGILLAFAFGAAIAAAVGAAAS